LPKQLRAADPPSFFSSSPATVTRRVGRYHARKGIATKVEIAMDGGRGERHRSGAKHFCWWKPELGKGYDAVDYARKQPGVVADVDELHYLVL